MVNEKELIGFIENLLNEHDCIIIPNFGGFVMKSTHFTFRKESNKIETQKRSVAFNEKLKNDDGFLTNEIAIEFKISTKKAQVQIVEFVNFLKNEISNQPQFDFGTIGTFALNKEHKLQFNPNDDMNFNLEMFGLEDVNTTSNFIPKKPILVSPIEVKEEQEIVSEEFIPISEEKREKRRIKNSIYAAVLFVLAGISTFVLTEPKEQVFTSSLNPFSSKTTEQTNKIEQPSVPHHAIAVVKPVEKVQVEKEATELKKEIELEDSIELVAGSFLTEEKAQKGIQELLHKGIDEAYIIPKKDSQKYFRISLGTAENMEIGYKKASEIKKEHKIDIWVFENHKN